ncbi:PRTRC system protein E [Stutzerimonas stutzeri]|uniref:PRTRC system protein E n=1 Tax=Stutzerimonas stutzeri TaxID=316 RepID=A0AA40RWB2_STUST|nr:PRTRC system protein E [Stutzerimonas stutzeri]MBA1306654.1 PRTRC system protein E [Stutzerimonas stutzeri]
MQQQLTFLQVIGEALSAGQNAGIEVQGLGAGKMRLVYTPRIGETPEGASAEVVALRAAIATPFVVTGTAEEIEQAFSARIHEKAAVVNRGLSALDEIDRLANAAKANAKGSAKGAASPAPNAQDTEDDDLGLGEADGVREVAAVTTTEPDSDGSISAKF